MIIFVNKLKTGSTFGGIPLGKYPLWMADSAVDAVAVAIGSEDGEEVVPLRRF